MSNQDRPNSAFSGLLNPVVSAFGDRIEVNTPSNIPQHSHYARDRKEQSTPCIVIPGLKDAIKYGNFSKLKHLE